MLTKSKILWLLVVLLLSACAQPTRSVTSSSIIVACVNDRVSPWRVSAGGDYQRLPVELDSSISGSLGRWQMCPLVSPDNNYIAFTKDGDIWLYEVRTGQQRQITSLGRKETETHAAVYAAPHLWSPDSGQLLYHVEHSDLEDIEGYRPPLQAPDAPYGFSILDTVTGQSTRLDLDERVHAWMPDGSLLFEPEVNPPYIGQLWTFNPETGTSTQVTNKECWYGQIALSGDGQKLVYICGARSESQVQELNLVTKEVKDLTEVGAWAEYNWPSISPSGNTAYIRQVVSAPIPQGYLFANGQNVAYCNGSGRSKWLNGQTILWTCGNQASVVDTTTGKTLSAFTYY